MDTFVISETNRLHPCLSYKGYKFRSRQGREAWLCCRKFCSAKVIVVEGTVRELEGHVENCAPSSQQELERNMLRASTKRKAVESLDARPAKVLRRCLGESQYENIDIGDTKLIRRSIYRQRRKNIPALPKSHDSALEAFRTMELTTKTGEKFVHVSESGVVLLTCRSNLEMLAKCDTWLGDGTFDRSPDLFNQLYTMHGHYEGYNMPLVYCPLARKDTKTYEDMLTFLKQLCLELCGIELRPKTVLLDFEAQMHTAVRTVLGAVVKACRFHLSQSFQRNLKTPDLRNAFLKIERHTPEGRWLISFFGLSLLAPEEVAPAVKALELSLPEGEAWEAFLQYVRVTYTNENARFPPHLWAEAPSCIPSVRTTNAAEGFHSDFNKQFNSSHPNIHILCEGVLLIQNQTYVTMNTIKKGKEHREPVQTRERRMRSVMAYMECLRQERGILSYLRFMGNVYSS